MFKRTNVVGQVAYFSSVTSALDYALSGGEGTPRHIREGITTLVDILVDRSVLNPLTEIPRILTAFDPAYATYEFEE